MREGDSSIKPQTCLGITKSKNGVCVLRNTLDVSRTPKEKRDKDGDESHGDDPEVKFV